ncbi:MAG: hypothetical protein ACFE9L_15915 [Candidatus Hodarchaeota archaeon]
MITFSGITSHMKKREYPRYICFCYYLNIEVMALFDLISLFLDFSYIIAVYVQVVCTPQSTHEW